jgi:5-methylcytosine-specific restriction endonuclease McrA
MQHQESLLTREQYKNAVFKRDNHTCIFCDLPAVDAHHILDRKLFADGGYYLSNGASVCEQHHWDCEKKY